MDNNGHKLFLDQIPDFTGIRSLAILLESKYKSTHFETQMILDNS